MRKCKLIATLLIVGFAMVTASAGVPHQINIQGIFTDAGGNPVANGSYQIIFRIYSTPSGGNDVWSSGGAVSVTVSDGVFTYLLGSSSSLPDSLVKYDSLWVGITLDAEPEMTPRIPLASVAYALRAGHADTAQFALATPGGGASHWTVIDSVLTTTGYWGISRGGAGNSLYGDSAHTMVNLGIGGSTGTLGQSYGYSTIGGGKENISRAWFSSVGGGDQNTAGHNYTTVAGGQRNTANWWYGAVGGGFANHAAGPYAALAGGYGDTVKAMFGGVSAGYQNKAGDEDIDSAAVVGGGTFNAALAPFSTIAGGTHNTLIGWWGTIGGGQGNIDSSLGGGGTIAGGKRNKVRGFSGAVVGGELNEAFSRSFVGGGAGNKATGYSNVIGGGYLNNVPGANSVIGGGEQNYIDGNFSSILGGYKDTISADYSYLFGIKSKLTLDSTFMVDMPHIRFGKETGGYEFPTADGVSGQMMATDGTGKLSWAAPSASAGGWTDDGATVRLTTAGDKVGIGTTVPQAKLHVESSSSTGYLGGPLFGVRGAHTPTLNVGFLGTDQYGAYGEHWSTHNHGILGSGTAGVYGSASTGHAGYFDGNAYVSGNLGVGTSTPKVKLDVSDMLRVGGDTWPGLGSGEGLELAYSASNNLGYIQSFDRTTGSWMDLSIGAQRVMVGANTPAPSARLHIYNYTSDWNTPQLRLEESGFKNYSCVIHSSSGLQFRNYYATGSNTAYSFGDSDNAPLLEITAEGSVVFPSRSVVPFMGGDAQDQYFNFYSGDYMAPSYNAHIRAYGHGSSGKFIEINHDGANANILANAGNINLQPASNVGIGTTAPAYKLDVAGSAHATSFPTSSDSRLKMNIRPLNNVLDRLLSVRGVSFDWNETYEKLGRSSGHREIGVIAQDVEAVFPELVTKWGDENYRAVDYGRLTAVLVEAVKELKAENDDLRQRLEALEKKVNER